jgi:hypothetical protein
MKTSNVQTHGTFVILALLATYLVRDIWPLLTYTLHPLDAAEGNILWIKIALVTLSSVVLPLTEPYPYEPLDSSVSTTI